MQSDTRPGDPTSARSGPQLSVELLSVVSSARRRASRDGDRQIDTAHLLHSLLESDPRAREALAAGSADGSARVARVLAYLVQRTIGYGMQWRGTVEDSGALPVLAKDAAPGCSPSAAAVLDEAAHRAMARGAAAADGVDLLAALAADPECRAVEVLRAAGFDAARLAAALPGRGTARGHLDDGPTVAC
ncbi:Clp protease N-terminal domain-containing protein [Streptantibioticus rubrisoli]|uniref:Peptidase n=1 Tax=Streptantibioticus rubrisoli TaxID=1387313 RepID=A0ABT1PLR9_9ACTN|nr:Clp protease N-terminal domain-containing protein [Streptantibioticus rubrisoli]MCQ4046313.1 peptidase [Streptantibioticus rubrisoli]